MKLKFTKIVKKVKNPQLRERKFLFSTIDNLVVAFPPSTL